MKMEQPITAHRAGVIKSIGAAVGETVPAGTVLLVFED
jgi:acetyl-CoA/propionyl-CoA carboxylase biotin carboxyl carrier protein